MTQQIINTGTGPNAQDGDSLYVAFTKVNDNFNSIWAQGPVDSNLSVANNAIISTDVNGNIVLTPNGIGYVRLDNNTIPGANNAYFLGDSTRRWRGIYAGSAGINTTGNLYAGNLIISGNTEFTGDVNFTGNLSTSENFSAAGNITGGGSFSIPGNITAGPGLFYGDVGITGNLQVAGNIVYIDVEELRIEDPIIELGGGPNGTPLTSADGFSRGLQLDYFNVGANAQQIAFTGLAAPDYTTYQFLTNATNTANTYTGTPANLYFGNATVTGQISTAGNIDTSNAVNATLVNATTFSGTTASITGNIHSGNIFNDGIISSVGNINSTSNIAGAYFLGNGAFLTGVITSVSNIANGTTRVDIPSSGSNVLVSVNGTSNVAVFATTGLYVDGVVSSTSNVVSNNFIGNTVSVTANISGGNISTTGRIVAGTTLSAVGNISGSYFLGNGALLTGIDTTLISNGTSNVRVATTNGNVEINIAGNNVATYDATGEFVTGIISATGTIVGSYLYSSGELSAAGNVVGNNLNVTNIVSASGNVYGGNLVSGTLTTTAGNLTVSSPDNIILQPAGNVVLFDHYINGVADPVQAQDAATKSYVDNAVSAGLNIHLPVYLESPEVDGNLDGVYANGGTTPTVTDIANNRILTTSSAHGLAINDMIVFDTSSNGLVAGTAYFVYNIPAANQLGLADAYDGAEITDLIDGTGLVLTSRANSGVGATLTNAGPNAALQIDGVFASSGDRVLIYTQTNAYENGVYVVTEPGSVATPWVLTRASDSDKYIPNSPEGTSIGDYFFVQAGDTGAGSSYVLNQPVNPIIFGISGIDFVQFSSVQVYDAGLGLELDATTFNVLVDPSTLEINLSNQVAIKAGANLVTPNIGDATGTSLSLSGNITAGNANIGNITITSVSVTGNVVGGNILTGGIVSATGNITGANLSGSNLLTSGLISATGNITGANVNAVTFYGNVKGGNISLSANVVAGNINTSGQVSATGNAIFGNISTAGNAVVNGVLTDNYYYANGAPVDFMQPAGANTQLQYNDNNDFGASANLTFNSATNILNVGGNVTATGNINGGNILTFGNAVVSGIKTDNYMYANGQPLDMQQPAGSNTQIQFNNNDEFGASANLTFDTNTSILSVNGNVVSGNTSTGIANAAQFVSNTYDSPYLLLPQKADPAWAFGMSSSGNLVDMWMQTSFWGNNQATHGFRVYDVTGSGSYPLVVDGTGNTTVQNLIATGYISTTGNIDASNVNTDYLSSGPADFLGNVNIVGNLYVDGNVTYIDVKDLRVEDPIIDLGGGPNGAPLTVSDGFSRGLKLEYYNTLASAPQFGFMGLAASDYTTYQFLTNATDTGNTFAGTAANLYFGNASVVSNVATGGILTDNYYYANGAPVDFMQPAGANTQVQFNNNNDFGASAAFTFNTATNVLAVTGNVSSTANVIAGNLVTLGNADVGGIKTDNYMYANGQPLDMQQPAGSNTWIQYNDNNDFGASANLAFDSAINQFYVNGTGSFVGNIVGGNVFTGGRISATGNIDAGNLSGEYVIGTLSTATQPNITSVGTLTSLNSGTISSSGNITGANLITSGLISATGNITGNVITANTMSTVGNAHIGGNLYVNGNVTYINITDLNVQDPIISMGRGPNGTPLTTNDGYDRGEQLWYYTNQEYSAFIGWDNSTNNLIAALDVTNNNEVISINNWGNFVVGNLYSQALNSANILFVNTSSNVVTIGNSTVTDGATLAINATDSALMPIGNSSQRPGTPAVGMVRFNTSIDTLEFYTDVDGWISAGATEIGSITSQTFTADGSSTVFTLTNPSTTVDSMVQINGVTQVPTAAYSIVGTTLTFTEAPEPGDTIEVRELAAQSTVHSITNSSGNAVVSVNDSAAQVNFIGNLIPDANVAYNLGSPTNQWNDLYLSGNTIYLGGTTMSSVSGNLSVTGNIVSEYIYGNGAYLTGISGGSATLSGNLAGNLDGNGYGANAFAFVSATGNIIGGNILTSGLLSATGNISTTANISGGYVLGNAAFMTGIPASYGNANVVANLAALGSNPISTTGNITGATIFGTTHSGNLVGTSASLSGTVTAASTVGGVITGTSASLSANVTGGNLLTGGLISATGNITGATHVGTTFSGNLTGTSASLSGTVTAASTVGGVITGTSASLSANVTGGNILTSGLISATGNITGATITGTTFSGNLTGTTASLSANVTGGNLLTGGLISATGNITGATIIGTTHSGNLTGTSASLSGTVTAASTVGGVITGTSASLSANVTGGNILTGGVVSSTGNLTSGNISTGIVSASGNVTAQNFIGNISITGNVTGTSPNVSIVAGSYTSTFDNTGNITFTNSNVSATGTITSSGNANATAFAVVGNGAVSNVALGFFPTGNVAAMMAIRDYSVANSTIYLDTTIGSANTGGSFQFRGSNAFTQYANINQYGITLPTRPAFRVYGAGNTNPNATTTLTGNNFTVDYQQGSALNTTTGIFTAPAAGLYQIDVTARARGNTFPLSSITCQKVVGNTVTNQTYIEFGVNTTMNHAGSSTVTKLAIGDQLQLVVNAGNITFDSNDSWSVTYIG